MELFLNILAIIAALAWIVMCVVAFSAIRLWKQRTREERYGGIIARGIAAKQKRK